MNLTELWERLRNLTCPKDSGNCEEAAGGREDPAREGPPGRGTIARPLGNPCQNLESGKNPEAPGEAVAVAADPVPQIEVDDAPVAGAAHHHDLRKRRRQAGEFKDLHEGKSSKTDDE